MGSGGGGSGFVNNDYILKGVTNTSKHTGNGLAKITYYDTIGCLTRKPIRNMNILLYVLIASLAK